MELCYINNSKSLFKKYAKLVTWFANTNDGRDYLNLPKNEKIALFLPNGYHITRGDQYQLTVYTRAIYAPYLYDVLKKIDYFSGVASFEEQQKLLFYETGLLMPYSKLLPEYDIRRMMQRVMWNSLTVNPDASPETTTVDGYAGRETGGEAWSSLQGDIGTTSNHTDAADNQGVWAHTVSNQFLYLYRTFHLFDTSSILAGSKIISAIHSPYTNSKTNGLGSINLHSNQTSPDSNTTLANSDFANTNSTSFGSVAYASIAAGGYSDITLNASGIANITIAGISKFGLRNHFDITNSAPTWSSGASSIINHNNSDAGSNKPKMVITYTPPAGGAFLQRMMQN